MKLGHPWVQLFRVLKTPSRGNLKNYCDYTKIGEKDIINLVSNFRSNDKCKLLLVEKANAHGMADKPGDFSLKDNVVKSAEALVQKNPDKETSAAQLSNQDTQHTSVQKPTENIINEAKSSTQGVKLSMIEKLTNIKFLVTKCKKYNNLPSKEITNFLNFQENHWFQTKFEAYGPCFLDTQWTSYLAQCLNFLVVCLCAD